MTRERLSECLALLGWSNAHLARELNRSEAAVGRWVTGRGEVPLAVEWWLETLVTLHGLFPPPGRDDEQRSEKSRAGYRVT